MKPTGQKPQATSAELRRFRLKTIVWVAAALVLPVIAGSTLAVVLARVIGL